MGGLPCDIEKIFNILDPGNAYYRQGVHRSHSSFIEAVMVGMYNKTGILEVDADDRLGKVLEVRDILSNRAVVCRQEIYDNNVENIRKYIENNEIYLDPKQYLRLLETYYKCNIFIFTRKHVGGELEIPRHLQAYYKYKNDFPVIFIYEHIGSESDNAKYPQCELIVRWNEQSGTDNNFLYQSTVSKGIHSVFSRMNFSYILNKPIKPVEFPKLPIDIQLISQDIDSYGKTRSMLVKFQKSTILLLTEPIPPLFIPEKKITKIHKTMFVTAMEFLQENATEIKKNIKNNKIVGLSGILGTVNITIPIYESENNINMILEEIPGDIYPDNKSVMLEFNNNKKTARYIIEYMFYLFSHYINDNRIENITDEDVVTFVEKYTKVDQDFIYGKIPKTFKIGNDSGIMDDQLLVLHSNEILRRLLYVLRLELIRDLLKIVNYHKKIVIVNYFLDITDFENYPFQVILEGDDSVEKWINEKKIEYIITDKVKLEWDTPYFFRNYNINNKIFLAQNTDSFEKGLNIVSSWVNKKYNIDGDAVPINRMESLLYSYRNENDITIHKIGGEISSYIIRIIG